MNYLFYLVPVGAAAALLFAGMTARQILTYSEGNAAMKKIAAAIRKGANAYLKRQYIGVGFFFAVMVVILVVLAYLKLLTPFVPVAFLTGGFFSGLAGYFGMKIATAYNARTAQAAKVSINRGLKVAFKSGAVMGFTVVGLALLDWRLWFFFLKWFYNHVPWIIFLLLHDC